jgi:hypothetical protein
MATPAIARGATPPSRLTLARAAGYRGRLGLYASVGVGGSFEGSATLAAIVGVAARWRLVDLALEGLGGYWSAGFGAADVAVMLHHTVGPVLLGVGVAAGYAHADARSFGLGRGFGRVSLAVTPALDLFAQVDFAYVSAFSNRREDLMGLMLDLGAQVRLFR